MPGRPLLVAVDGRSGSGKTVLAADLAELVRATGRSCSVVHLEDIYPGWDGLAAALPRLCGEVLDPLRAGRRARFISWDWHRSRRGPALEVAAADVVVVEGVGASAVPGDRYDLVLWLTAAPQVRRRRALRRDASFAPYWESWAAQEQEVFRARGGANAADLVIVTDPDGPTEPEDRKDTSPPGTTDWEA